MNKGLSKQGAKADEVPPDSVHLSPRCLSDSLGVQGEGAEPASEVSCNHWELGCGEQQSAGIIKVFGVETHLLLDAHRDAWDFNHPFLRGM